METGVPPTHRYPTRSKLGRHNSRSSLSQEKPRVDDKAKHRVFARCKRKGRKRHTRVIYLPREVIFNILRFLPANVLQDVMRYVCKQWYDIISDPFFIRAHCQMPTTTTATSASFIIQSFLEKRKKFERRHKVYYFDKDVTKIELPFPAMINGSSNGLVLLFDYRDSQKFYLANPLSKRIICLPSVLVHVVRSALSSTSLCSFAVNSSGQYKMVHLCACEHPTSYDVSLFTIGIDKAWRRIPLTGPLEICGPLLIAGIMYWCRSTFPFLAMDIDTETLYLISYSNNVDRSVFDEDDDIYFISMGSALGIMVEVDIKHSIWKLLKLTDVKSSEWTEIGMIDIGAMVSKVSNGKWTTYEDVAIKPVSLINGELCFYCGVSKRSSWLIRYNLANESFVFFVVKMSYRTATVLHHVPTFVSP